MHKPSLRYHLRCQTRLILAVTRCMCASITQPLPPCRLVPQVVESEIVRAAIGANLVTRHTSAVGIMLQANPLDAAKVRGGAVNVG